MVKGFTLIELIVVIAIIGLLVSMGSMGYQRTLISSRDVKRIADAHELKKAVELYYIHNGSYPPSTRTCGSGGSLVIADSISLGSNWMPDLVGDYMQILPRDPLNRATDTCPEAWDGPEYVTGGEWVYTYLSSSDGQHYEIIVPLEQDNHKESCSQKCWVSTVHEVGSSWCNGASNQCLNPISTFGGDERGQRTYVLSK